VYVEPPLGLAYVASYLEKYCDDAKVKILDAAALEMGINEVSAFIKREKPDIVGATAVTLTASFVKKLFKGIKEWSGDILTVAGGPHPTALPFDLMPEADISVIGEGEQTMVDVVAYSMGTKKIEEVAGTSYVKDGSLSRNLPRELIQDLDSIPYPARHLLPMEKYTHQYPHKTRTKFYTTMMTARGCPYGCVFCGSKKTWGRRVRFRSVENTFGEIEQAVNKYKVSFIYFFDDTFTLQRDRVLSICQKMNEAKLDISWACFSRVDRADRELLRIMKKAGCVEIQLGVESGDQEILRRMNKGITIQQARAAFKAAKEVGIDTKGFFMIGNPGETTKTVERTIKFATELDPTYAFFSILIPFPGLQIHEDYKKREYIKTFDWDRYNYYGYPVFETEDLSAEAMKKFQRMAEIRFYTRPKKIAKYAWDALKAGKLRVLMRNFFAFLDIVTYER
jgi:radical SAM superfamily enzyme YgiQ (UPF0313 family)